MQLAPDTLWCIKANTYISTQVKHGFKTFVFPHLTIIFKVRFARFVSVSYKRNVKIKCLCPLPENMLVRILIPPRTVLRESFIMDLESAKNLIKIYFFQRPSV